MRCPNCGAEVGEGELFCGECGARIVQPTVPTSTPTVVTPPAREKAGGSSKALLGGGAAVVVVGVVVVCLCLAVLVGAVASGVLNPPQPTATSVAEITPAYTPAPTVAPGLPTATTLRPTPTFRPSPTGGPVGTPAITTGQPFTDDFSKDTGNWLASTSDRGRSYIKDGELHIEVTQTQSIVWTTYDKGVYQDLAMEMDGRKVSGSDTNDYGLIFRLVDRGNFYRFVVSSQGQYTLDQYLKSNWNTIKKWTTHSAIKKGTEINHLKVIAQGSTFQLYVNDTLVDTITDNSIPQAGKVALSGGSYDAPNVHVAFDNVQVLPAGVAFYDDFTDNRNNWTTSDKVFFDGGEYHLYDKESGRIVWNNSAGTYGNFTIEAKIRKVEGPDDKDYGIALRLLDADNYYSFTILGDGRYRFDKQVNNEWVFLLGPKESSALNKGNVTNILRVVCKGQTFDLYINGQKVDSVQDDFRSDGNIGFYTSQNVHMAVEYVTVWKE